MSRYIDPCILAWKLESGKKYTAGEVRDLINDAPAADVKEVVRGKWVEHINGHSDYFECDQCGYIPDSPLDETNFCPNCGAKMEV